MAPKLVSVIIPSYNYSQYIPETIESIRQQTYPHWEVVVVDDGSVDDTAAVVARFTEQDSRVKYHYQNNQGLSAARNTGIALAQGDYIQLLDADDYICKDKLRLQVEVLEQHPNADLVYGDTYIFTNPKDPSVAREFSKFQLTKPPMSGQGAELALHMVTDNIFLVGCPLFRRSMALAAGEFDRTLFSLEDWHFWYRAALLGNRFIYDNREGTEFYVRTHGGNMSGNRYKMWKYKIQARQSLIRLISQKLKTNPKDSTGLRAVLQAHQVKLYEEQARFNLMYENFGVGIVNTVQYFLHGERKGWIWYDSAYWIKERLLGRK